MLYLQFQDSVNLVIDRLVQLEDGSIVQETEPRSFTRGQGILIDGVSNGVIMLPGALINGLDPSVYSVLSQNDTLAATCCN